MRCCKTWWLREASSFGGMPEAKSGSTSMPGRKTVLRHLDGPEDLWAPGGTGPPEAPGEHNRVSLARVRERQTHHGR